MNAYNLEVLPVYRRLTAERDRARALAVALEGQLAQVAALRLDEELAELQSFVWVETRHEPTRASVAELRRQLRAILTPDTDA